MKRNWLWVCSALVASGMLGACQPQADADLEPPPKVEGDRISLSVGAKVEGLRIETVEGPAPDKVQLPARLVWNEDHTARVYSPLQGHVIKLNAQIGDPVRAGQPLAVLSAPDLGQAQAEWQRAVADLEQAKRQLERQRELFENEVIAQKDYYLAQAEYQRAQAERSRTEARLKLYEASGHNVDQSYVLRTPVSGTVVERNITPGLEVRADQNNGPLFVVSDTSSLWVTIDAREEHLRFVKPGTEFIVRYLAAGAEAKGTLTFVSDQVDPGSRTIKLRGLVANPRHNLKADAYVTAEFSIPAGEEPRVRGTAIFLMGDRTYVFVANGEREFVRRAVKVGAEHDGWMRVSEGLRQGERVVTEGNLHLQRMLPAMPVRPAAPSGGPPGKSA